MVTLYIVGINSTKVRTNKKVCYIGTNKPGILKERGGKQKKGYSSSWENSRSQFSDLVHSDR